MKTYLTENNDLMVESDSSDQWTGKVKAVKTVYIFKVGTVLECGTVSTPNGEAPLMIKLADKPALSELVDRWEQARLPIDRAATEAIVQAKATGKTVTISSWTENRRYRDCGQWVEGICQILRIARPDGSLGQQVIPCH